MPDISQGSVATHLRRDEVFNDEYITHFCRVFELKNVEHQSAFGAVVSKSKQWYLVKHAIASVTVFCGSLYRNTCTRTCGMNLMAWTWHSDVWSLSGLLFADDYCRPRCRQPTTVPSLVHLRLWVRQPGFTGPVLYLPDDCDR